MKGKFVIKVRGCLDEKWKDNFEGMEILHEGNFTHILGIFKDESHIHGILNQIRDLNLTIISLNPVTNNE